MRVVALLAILSLPSCSSSEEPAPGPQPLTIRVDECPNAELPLIGGGCKKVGALDCGPGFTLDPDRGCNAVLPSSRCAAGTMAVPGDPECRPVDDCGTGTWGAIPVSATTKYVDASYLGGGSDGTATKPFVTIQPAIAAAEPGAVIAIAEGRYAEDVRVNRAVKLWGRCAQKVTIAGGSTFALDITARAEVHDLAVTGPDVAVGVAGTTALLERVWIHDAGDRGLDVEDIGGATEVTLRDSLIEKTAQIGVYVEGSGVTVERSVIRGTRGAKKGEVTEGILARAGEVSHAASRLRVTASLVDDNTVFGVLAYDSSAEITGSVIRGTKRSPTSPAGGVTVQKLPAGESATLIIKQSLVDAHEGVGIDVASARATIDTVTIRDITGVGAGGMLLEEADAKVANTTLVDLMGTGLSVSSAKAEISGVRIARVSADLGGGVGPALQIDLKKGTLSEVSVRESVVRDVMGAGIGGFGSRITVSDVAVFDVKAIDGRFGDGIAMTTSEFSGAVAVVDATVTRAVVRNAARAALTVFGGTLRVGESVLCSPLDINIEKTFAYSDLGETFDHEVVLEDLGGNGCGCGTLGPCVARSSGLVPVPR